MPIDPYVELQMSCKGTLKQPLQPWPVTLDDEGFMIIWVIMTSRLS